MELNEADQESIFFDVLINTFMINPQLYDKSEGTYVYTPEKIKILQQLSEYLKNEFDITKSASEIVSAWKKLVTQFKKADENKASGSAAAGNEFTYYKDLLFLKPTLQHRKGLSSTLPPINSVITVPSGTAQQFSNSTSINTFPSAESSSSTNAVASPDVFGSHVNLPHGLPYTLPPGGQHPYWPMMSPYAFGPAVPFPYMPFAPPAVPNYNMSSVNATHLAGAFAYNCNAATPLAKLNPTVTKQKIETMTKHAASSSKRIPEYDAFAKKKFKALNEDEHQLKELNNRIISTLDHIDNKCQLRTSNETSQSNLASSLNSASSNAASAKKMSSPIHSSSHQSSTTSEPASSDYSNLLAQSLSKVPIELQDELMEYLFDELIEFNQQYKEI